ncbi:MAG: hypothetical protein ACKPKO_42860 [Candidatus Fonsibacter sp.]
MALDRKQIAYVKRQRSRACTIFNNYPQRYLLQNEIGLLDLDHDEQPEHACLCVCFRTAYVKASKLYH